MATKKPTTALHRVTILCGEDTIIGVVDLHATAGEPADTQDRFPKINLKTEIRLFSL